jgi:hypothetical protein
MQCRSREVQRRTAEVAEGVPAVGQGAMSSESRVSGVEGRLAHPSYRADKTVKEASVAPSILEAAWLLKAPCLAV